MKRLLMMSLALIVLGVHVATAAPPDRQSADEAAIRKAVRSYVTAFARGDAKAVASHWSAEGVYVSPDGRRLAGREAIEQEFAAYFAESTGQSVEVGDPTVRFIALTVATEEGIARVSRTGEPPVETSYIAIHVKQNGRWKMDSVRETVVPTTPSHHEQLRELEWLIGEWVDADGESTVHTVCQWTKNKNFITRSFSVAIKDRVELEGTQVIGYDPAAAAIRSWMFDSEGGFGEAHWSREGNRWIIKASRTLNGGEKASAVNIVTVIDENAFTWQSIGREIDGDLQPNIEPVTVVRKQSDK